MYILGLNAYHADSSAAIFKNGELIAATEEERFTRLKHWAGFPAEAILFCMNEAGIEINDLDYIAIGRDPKAKIINKAFFLLSHPSASYFNIRERIKNTRHIAGIENDFLALFPKSNKSILRPKIRLIEHHRAHLASAFFASPFDEAAIFSIDGSGDFTTTMFARGKDSKIIVLNSIDFPHSLGLFYTALTQYLGFPNYGDEYKIMGLAPYGKPIYISEIGRMIQIKKDGMFRLDLSYFNIHQSEIIRYSANHQPIIAPLFSKKLEVMLGKARKGNGELTQHHKNIARSIQEVTEQIYLHLLNELYQKSHLRNVCIAGGVAQNSVINGKILRDTGFEKVYIPSASHDAGISMGAALYLYNHILGQPREPAIWSAYTGAHFTNDEIETILKNKGIYYSKLEDDEIYKITVESLKNGGVVGWFSGRAEFGPRALGARSIIVDPRRHDAKDLLNRKIKRRESFRPFAPSILEEFVSEYFELADKVPFMEKVLPIKKEKQSLIPAVTHIDGSGRLQTVNKIVSPRYYQLIETFRKHTGVPILLNTSFNENEPIVNSPEHAIDCYLRTSMDMLVLENCVITRNYSGNN